MTQNIPLTLSNLISNCKEHNKGYKLTEKVFIPPEYHALREAIKNNNDSTVLYLYHGSNR